MIDYIFRNPSTSGEFKRTTTDKELMSESQARKEFNVKPEYTSFRAYDYQVPEHLKNPQNRNSEEEKMALKAKWMELHSKPVKEGDSIEKEQSNVLC